MCSLRFDEPPNSNVWVNFIVHILSHFYHGQCFVLQKNSRSNVINAPLHCTLYTTLHNVHSILASTVSPHCPYANNLHFLLFSAVANCLPVESFLHRIEWPFYGGVSTSRRCTYLLHHFSIKLSQLLNFIYRPGIDYKQNRIVTKGSLPKNKKNKNVNFFQKGGWLTPKFKLSELNFWRIEKKPKLIDGVSFDKITSY